MLSWLVTVTTYGTWLPGDPRGSITRVRDRRPSDPPSHVRYVHNRFQESPEPPIPGLYQSAAQHLVGDPIFLDAEQAQLFLGQFRQTAELRGWRLCAVAIMRNHFHLIANVPDEIKREKVRADFKAYASRILNERYGEPPSGTWWTGKGSVRRLEDDDAFHAAMHYVLFDQEFPLVVWSWNQPGR